MRLTPKLREKLQRMLDLDVPATSDEIRGGGRNMLPTLIYKGLAHYVGNDKFEITDKGREYL